MARTTKRRLRPKVSNAQIDAYRSAVSTIETTTWATINDLMTRVDFSNIGQARRQVIAILDLLDDACDAASVVSANFYDTCRETAGLERINALAIYDRLPHDTREATVRYKIGSVMDHDGDTTAFFNMMQEHVGYELKRAGGSTIYRNGKRDPRKVLYEWTTRSPEPCAFCRYLEDQGAVSYSADAEHYHPHCRCVPVPVWTL